MPCQLRLQLPVLKSQRCYRGELNDFSSRHDSCSKKRWRILFLIVRYKRWGRYQSSKVHFLGLQHVKVCAILLSVFEQLLSKAERWNTNKVIWREHNLSAPRKAVLPRAGTRRIRISCKLCQGVKLQLHFLLISSSTKHILQPILRLLYSGNALSSFEPTCVKALPWWLYWTIYQWIYLNYFCHIHSARRE